MLNYPRTVTTLPIITRATFQRQRVVPRVPTSTRNMFPCQQGTCRDLIIRQLRGSSQDQIARIGLAYGLSSAAVLSRDSTVARLKTSVQTGLTFAGNKYFRGIQHWRESSQDQIAPNRISVRLFSSGNTFAGFRLSDPRFLRWVP